MRTDRSSGSAYYPFGMMMPHPQNTQPGGHEFGYQGSEQDDEIHGNGNSYTTKFRKLDPRIARWWSIDPKAAKYPNRSPYEAMGSTRIWANDPLGDEFTEDSEENVQEVKDKINERQETVRNKLEEINKDLENDNLSKEGEKAMKSRKKELNKIKEELNSAEQEIEEMAQDENVLFKLEQDGSVDGGSTEYKDGKVVMKYDNQLIGDNLDQAAHELKHGHQYLKGELSFTEEGEPGSLKDITDEVEAYKRQYAIHPEFADGNPTMEDINRKSVRGQRSSAPRTANPEEKFPYKDLPKQERNLNNYTPNPSEKYYDP